jgi:ribosomal protein S27AE
MEPNSRKVENSCPQCGENELIAHEFEGKVKKYRCDKCNSDYDAELKIFEGKDWWYGNLRNPKYGNENEPEYLDSYPIEPFN